MFQATFVSKRILAQLMTEGLWNPKRRPNWAFLAFLQTIFDAPCWLNDTIWDFTILGTQKNGSNIFYRSFHFFQLQTGLLESINSQVEIHNSSFSTVHRGIESRLKSWRLIISLIHFNATLLVSILNKSPGWLRLVGSVWWHSRWQSSERLSTAAAAAVTARPKTPWVGVHADADVSRQSNL